MNCIYCNSFWTVKNGRDKKRVQRYKCNECHRRFCEKGLFIRFRTDKQFIFDCLYLRSHTLSLREVKRIAKKFFKIKRSHVAIYNWVMKFQPWLAKIEKSLPLNISDIWHVDEKFIHVRGSKDKHAYLYVVADSNNNVIATLVANSRSGKNAEIILRKARERAGLNFKDYEYIEKHTNKKKAVYKFRFHHLRHFYATYVYEKTRDLYAVANLLGHKRIDTTQIYAKVSNKILKENVDFAFNTPIISQSFENNNLNTFKVPEIIKAKQEKSPVQILEERFARGEISAVDFQTAIRLLKVRKDYLNENEKQTEPYKEVEHN